MFTSVSTLFLACLLLLLMMLKLRLATALSLDDRVGHRLRHRLRSEFESTLDAWPPRPTGCHSTSPLGLGGVVYNHLYCSVGDNDSGNISTCVLSSHTRSFFSQDVIRKFPNSTSPSLFVMDQVIARPVCWRKCRVTVQADNVFSMWGDVEASFLPTRPHMGLSLAAFSNCCLCGLEQFLAHRLHGQPLAQTALTKAAQSFVGCDGDGTSAIVLALHGGSGTGKSYAARLLAEQLYWHGAASSCIHIIVPEQLTTATRHSSAEVQWVYLQSILQNGVSACKHTMFILEEIEEVSRELLCLLFTLLRDPVRGAFYHKALFLLISTVGDDYIWKATLEALEAGRSREEISIKQLERVIEETAGYACELDKRKGISSLPQVVTFLPLEHHHVALCACEHLLNHGTMPNAESSLHVADSIVSKSCRGPTLAQFGCKNVAGQILLHLN